MLNYNTYDKIPKLLQPNDDPTVGLSEDLYNFYKDLASLYDTKITSGYRAGAKTKQGNVSRHSKGEALDISPDKEVYNYLCNTPEGISLLYKYQLGVLDETTQEMLNKTGGTGAHYHVGKDTNLVEAMNARYNEIMMNGEYSQNERDGYSKTSGIDYGMHTEIPQFTIPTYVDFNNATDSSSQETALQERLLQKQKEYEMVRKLIGGTDVKFISSTNPIQQQ